MQYKIPVQIENDDPIFLGLSLKQIIIMIIGGSISYMIYNSLSPGLGAEISAIPAILIFLIFLMVVLFKHSEMTFIPFILNLIRLNLNSEEKIWQKSVDSFEPIQIGYVVQEIEKKKSKIDTKIKEEQINKLREKINKI